MTRARPYICGIDAAMDVVGGKWKALILWELDQGVKRFSALRRGLPGVSEKVLVQQLRELESDGIVYREVYPEVPPKVEYSLTETGHSLNTALEPLGRWGFQHMRHIESSRDVPPEAAYQPYEGMDPELVKYLQT